jgi:hypothetical protein
MNAARARRETKTPARAVDHGRRNNWTSTFLSREVPWTLPGTPACTPTPRARRERAAVAANSLPRANTPTKAVPEHDRISAQRLDTSAVSFLGSNRVARSWFDTPVRAEARIGFKALAESTAPARIGRRCRHRVGQRHRPRWRRGKLARCARGQPRLEHRGCAEAHRVQSACGVDSAGEDRPALSASSRAASPSPPAAGKAGAVREGGRGWSTAGAP